MKYLFIILSLTILSCNNSSNLTEEEEQIEMEKAENMSKSDSIKLKEKKRELGL